jgi:hypothetical protein
MITSEAFAWGDDGNKAVALIAQQCLAEKSTSQHCILFALVRDHLGRSASSWKTDIRSDPKHVSQGPEPAVSYAALATSF